MKKNFLLALFFVFFISNQSDAYLIPDTHFIRWYDVGGPHNCDPNGDENSNCGFGYLQFEGNGKEFKVINDSFKITSIFGSAIANTGGFIDEETGEPIEFTGIVNVLLSQGTTFSETEDDQYIPSYEKILFQQSFYIPGSGPGFDNFIWYGYRTDELNIVLEPGSYWLTAGAYLASTQANPGYMSFPDFTGEVIPEPATIVLFGAGILGIAARRKKVK